jgi:hypothetical protein
MWDCLSQVFYISKKPDICSLTKAPRPRGTIEESSGQETGYSLLLRQRLPASMPAKNQERRTSHHLAAWRSSQ